MKEYIVLSELHCRRRPCNPTFRSAACGAEIGRPFRTLLICPCLNPTFRYAACGAEIFCPFGASAWQPLTGFETLLGVCGVYRYTSASNAVIICQTKPLTGFETLSGVLGCIL
ncbi:hypothetical protein Barb4_02891 [Bacteroidales bacterium Barb4]|nr:hypothetical protein Barb4_02891 [Bacteroidales bacterium Barb4]